MRVLIFSPSKSAYSETFIRDHISGLPYDMIPLYGVELGLRFESGNSLLPFGSYVSFLGPRISLRAYEIFRNIVLSCLFCILRPSVALIEYGTTACFLYRALDLAGIPYVTIFHGYDAFKSTVVDSCRKNYKNIFKKRMPIIAVSSHMKCQLVSLGCPEDIISVSPCGVDPDLFPAVDINSNNSNFLMVGRMVNKKAPHLTILAFSRVVRVKPNAHLYICGDGYLHNVVHSMCASLGILGNVTFCGAVSHKDVVSLMRQSICFLQHSIVADDGDSEGSPVAIVEAQMSGLPVVATNHAGIPSLVLHGETGFLVEEYDVSQMAEYMLTVLEDRNQAAQMGVKARRRAVRLFSLHRHLKDVSSALELAASL